MAYRHEIMSSIADSHFVGVHRRIMVFNEVQGKDQNLRDLAGTVRLVAAILTPTTL
jgi:hypothetical protein